MERSTVVPEVVAAGRHPFGHVADNPLYRARLVAQPCLSDFERLREQVEHRNMGMAFSNESIDQPGSPPPMSITAPRLIPAASISSNENEGDDSNQLTLSSALVV